MAKVSGVMTKEVVQIESSATVFDAAKMMNEKGTTGVVVLQNGKPVGMLTERSLLKRFVTMNKRPQDVRVREIMGPLLKTNADEDTRIAAKKLLQNRLTRLGVFRDDKMVGWVTITDLSQESTKKHLLDILLHHHEPEPDEILCPNCRRGVLKKIANAEGQVLRWECSRCGHIE